MLKITGDLLRFLIVPTAIIFSGCGKKIEFNSQHKSITNPTERVDAKKFTATKKVVKNRIRYKKAIIKKGKGLLPKSIRKAFYETTISRQRSQKGNFLINTSDIIINSQFNIPDTGKHGDSWNIITRDFDVEIKLKEIEIFGKFDVDRDDTNVESLPIRIICKDIQFYLPKFAGKFQQEIKLVESNESSGTYQIVKTTLDWSDNSSWKILNMKCKGPTGTLNMAKNFAIQILNDSKATAIEEIKKAEIKWLDDYFSKRK